MLATLKSFDHKFDIDIPKPEMIEISTMSSSHPVYYAGRQKPATISINDEDDALMFKLKYFTAILEEHITQERISWGLD